MALFLRRNSWEQELNLIQAERVCKLALRGAISNLFREDTETVLLTREQFGALIKAVGNQVTIDGHKYLLTQARDENVSLESDGKKGDPNSLARSRKDEHMKRLCEAVTKALENRTPQGYAVSFLGAILAIIEEQPKNENSPKKPSRRDVVFAIMTKDLTDLIANTKAAGKSHADAEHVLDDLRVWLGEIYTPQLLVG